MTFIKRGFKDPKAEGFVVRGEDKEAGVKDALVVVVILLHQGKGEGEAVGIRMRVCEVVDMEGLTSGGRGKEVIGFGRGRRPRCQNCSRGFHVVVVRSSSSLVEEDGSFLHIWD
ncbi:hypothetical protein RJT34_28516 [Clitoria ternatea]|uniref:Uncharacterized protein n=1 Tax=Clitoria ternatea TaxID=43366 RepID=A0AAN9F8V4_CLITE